MTLLFARQLSYTRSQLYKGCEMNKFLLTLLATTLLGTTSFADTNWVTPSNTICKSKKGSISTYGVCQATWEDAQEICRQHDAILPSIEELKEVVGQCKVKDATKDQYIACYKKKGFTGSSSYWSSTTDRKYPKSAYGMNFYSASVASGSKTNTVDVICAKKRLK